MRASWKLTTRGIEPWFVANVIREPPTGATSRQVDDQVECCVAERKGMVKLVRRKLGKPPGKKLAHVDQTEQKGWSKSNQLRHLNSRSARSSGICLGP